MGRPLQGEWKICITCNKNIRVSPSQLKRGKGKYCSKACANFGKITTKNCDICKKEFTFHTSRQDEGRGKYCSSTCYRKSRKGKPAWNKGLSATWAIGNKHRLGKSNNNPYKMFGEDNHKWVGDEVGYHGLHLWVSRQLGKPNNCEHCGNKDLTHRQYHWANISGNYLRDIKDWKRLCVKCHKKYDASKSR